jgi:hypothetical protein
LSMDNAGGYSTSLLCYVYNSGPADKSRPSKGRLRPRRPLVTYPRSWSIARSDRSACLGLAEGLGLGVADREKIKIREVNLG